MALIAVSGAGDGTCDEAETVSATSRRGSQGFGEGIFILRRV